MIRDDESWEAIATQVADGEDVSAVAAEWLLANVDVEPDTSSTS